LIGGQPAISIRLTTLDTPGADLELVDKDLTWIKGCRRRCR
jgi:hypothetical protein